jgi:hypothetical protein
MTVDARSVLGQRLRPGAVSLKKNFCTTQTVNVRTAMAAAITLKATANKGIVK